MPNPFVHVELNTDDVGAARSFYKKLFGWKFSDMPMGSGPKYTMVDVGKGVGGGMMVKPMPDTPTMWLAYVQVDDVKKTMSRAATNGANVVVPYQEIQGMGALGIFIDPAGAVLGVWQPFMPARKAAPRKKAAAKPKRKPAKPKRRSAKR